MEFVILTGLSGSGKTYALHSMEDLGFYCVDNLPPILLDTFYELCLKSTDNRMKKVAVAVDARSGNIFQDLKEMLTQARLDKKEFKILFLDCKEDALLIRYKETRKKHPLLSELSGGSIEDAVALEAELLKPVKEMADYIIDTTLMEPSQLRDRIKTLFTQDEQDNLLVTCMSFGYKYGIPLEADIVIDVRCLPNPFYVAELKNMTGLDKEVQNYVINSDVTTEFIEKLLAYLDFTINQYQKDGKSGLVIGVGCTGGKHRSVTIARLINSHLIENKLPSSIHHRDIWKA